MTSLSDSRTHEIDHFLAGTGWGTASRAVLGQDASTRRYFRLTQADGQTTVSYTHLRAHETREELVCRLLLEKKN